MTELTATMEEIAVFWDIENVQPNPKTSIVKNIEKCIQKFGKKAIKKCFADWTKISRQASLDLINSGYELLHLPYDGKKNSTDIHLVINVTNILSLYPKIVWYVIVSSDHDFRPLISRIYQEGKKVVIIGDREKLKNFVLNPMIHEFIPLDDLYDRQEQIACGDSLSTTSNNSNLPKNLIPNKDFLTKTVFNYIKATLEVEKETKIPHNFILSRIKIYEPDLKDKLIAKFQLNEKKWFRGMLMNLSDKNLITLELVDTTYYVSLRQSSKTEADGKDFNTSLEKNRTLYFRKIKEIVKKEKNGSMTLTSLAHKLRQETQLTYKSIGEKKLIDALRRASEVVGLKLTLDKSKGLWNVGIR